MKKNLSVLLLTLLPVLAVATSTVPEVLTLHPEVVSLEKRQAFISHPDWLALPLAFGPLEKLRKDLEKKIGKPLQHQGEAHITIITPPEFSTLSSVFKMQEIEELMTKYKALRSPVELECVKKVTATVNKLTEESWFVAVRSKGLLEFRQEVWRNFVARGGDPESFRWQRWSPHITIGFTSRDLHDEDRVSKTDAPCVYTLKP